MKICSLALVAVLYGAVAVSAAENGLPVDKVYGANVSRANSLRSYASFLTIFV
jgi:hypothetical protein